MRTIYRLFILMLTITLGISAFAQQRTVKFTGRDRTNQYRVQLDRVEIFNLDQLWEEVIYWPDTTLMMGTVGIEDLEYQTSVQLLRNVPNPFNGSTEFALCLPEGRDVRLELFDVTGKFVVGEDFSALPAGTHLFEATLMSPQTYLLSATVKDGRMTLKMINEGHGGVNAIRYMGMTDLDGDLTVQLKKDRATGLYPFTVGDEMQYTGYTTIDGAEMASSTVNQNQFNDEIIPLLFDVTVPVVNTIDVTSVSANSATISCQVIDECGANVTSRGVCWSQLYSPTINGDHTTDGGGSGIYFSDITGLTPNTSYYVRAYATNIVGTSYGEQMSFMTDCDIVTVTVSGDSIIDYGQSTTLMASGATSYHWNTGANTANITVSPTSTTTYIVTGTNQYNCTATATKTVTVNPILPTVNTINVSDITSTTVSCGGHVVSEGGAVVTAYGVCWSTSHNPTINNTHTNDGSGSGPFSSLIMGLTPNTTYYVRAYATNSAGTAYGEEVTFTTACNPVTINIIGNTSVDYGQSVTLTAHGASSYQWNTGTSSSFIFSSITVSPTSTTNYTVTGTDSYGCTATATITVTVIPIIPTVTTIVVSDITANSASCGSHVTSNGGSIVTARGVCWSTSQTPTIGDSHTTDGSGNGSFSSYITGLMPNTTYYVRAYATNSVGTGYGVQKTFTTNCNTVNLSITGTTTIDYGESTTLTASGASSYQWSTNATTASITVSPTSPTTYTVTGTNSYGCTATAAKTVTVNPIVPTVTTNVVSNITANTASCGGNVTSNGGAIVTARGVCWSTSQNPTISDNHTTNGSGNGSFSSYITGLMPNTTYYVRAYAANSAGTGYGIQKSFTTNCNTVIYSVGFEDEEGFTASNVYNNTTVAFTGADGAQWGTFYGTPSTNNHIAGAQSMQMRWYASAAENIGYTYTNFDLHNVTHVTFAAMSTNGLNVKVSHSIDGGNTYSAGETFTLGSTASTFNYVVDEEGSYNFVRLKFSIELPETNPTSTSRVVIDSLVAFGIPGQTPSVVTPPVIDEKSCPAAPTVTDHEGNVYATVQIGNQCWMRDNLRTTTSPSTGTYLIPASSTGYTYTGKQARWYNNDSATYAPMNYGLLYNWNAAADTFNTAYGETSVNSNLSNAVSVTFTGHRRGICPAGWHLPSDAEWTQLTNYVSSQSEYTCDSNSNYIAKALASTEGWDTYTNNCELGNDPSTNNATGFSAVPAGFCTGSSFYYAGYYASFWSATQDASFPNDAYYRYLNYNNAGVNRYGGGKDDGRSVRCLRDAGIAVIDEKSCPTAPTVTDHEGNVYATVQIGNQCWMRDNLRTTTSPSTGTYLVNNEFTSGTNIVYTYTGKMARWYNNDSATYAPMNYGLLYNWNAAVDTFNTTYGETSVNTDYTNAVSVTFSGHRRGICPAGWHLPSEGEWATLTNYVSSQSEYVCGDTNINIAKALASTTGWDSNSVECNPSDQSLNTNNATGFSAAPAGGCYGSSFVFVGVSVYFWSDSQYSSNKAYCLYLGYEDSYVTWDRYDKNDGFSVRCLKDEVGPTTAQLPYVITTAVTNIINTTATCGGDIISDGGSNVTVRGICWSTSQNPSINDEHTTDGGGSGSFTSNLTGLVPGTTYYVRAYATNSVGTAYGAHFSFTANDKPELVCPDAATVIDNDGNVYNTVKIGDQCWMKENLRTTKFADGTNITCSKISDYTLRSYSYYIPYYYPISNNNNDATELKNGYIYNWAAVTNGQADYGYDSCGNQQGVCPLGWKVPGNADWNILINHLENNEQYWCNESNNNIVKSLAYINSWPLSNVVCDAGNEPQTNNSTGFSALNTGMSSDIDAFGAFPGTAFWSRTPYDEYNAYVFTLSGNSFNLYNHFEKYYGASLRCIKADGYLPVLQIDEIDVFDNYMVCKKNILSEGSSNIISSGFCWSTSPDPTICDSHILTNSDTGYINQLVSSTTYYIRAFATNNTGTSYSNQKVIVTTGNATCPTYVDDIDGNSYPTVRIGSLCWMAENLRTTHFSDGTGILAGESGTYYNDTIARLFFPNNDSSNVLTYGYLYNRVAIMQNICPIGWHIPSDAEYNQLEMYLNSNNYCCNSNSEYSIAKALASSSGWETSEKMCEVGCEQGINNTTGFNVYPAGHSNGNFGKAAYLWTVSDYDNYGLNFVCVIRYDAQSIFHRYSYSSAYSVRCLKDEVGSTSAHWPVVITTEVTNITGTIVTCGGDIASDGGATVTARGVCWSISQNPTINDDHTTDGSGTGIFISNLTGLNPNTTYYVRAYATNSVGTGYGEQRSFTTETVGPVIDEKSCPAAPTVTDHEGNVYATVQIGNQCWMRDNLRTTTSPSTGTYLIPAADTGWTVTGKQARWYNNDSATYAPMNYGLLYNWNAAVDTFNTTYGETSVNTDYTTNAVSVTFSGHRRGICPAGWHLPSDAEWTQLTNYVSSQSEYTCDSNSNYIAKALASTVGWNSSSSSCAVGNDPSSNNATGFSAVPAGYCSGSSFYSAGDFAFFWSSTQNGSYNACLRNLYYSNASVSRYNDAKSFGRSVRCLRDSGGGDGSSATLPTVTTNTISNITPTTATCGGNIIADGGASVTARGVCWSTSQNPTVNGSHTADGSGMGSFSSSISGLTANTTYYVRAYATNSAGTAYGETVAFTTLSAGGTAIIDAKSCPEAQTVTDHEGNVYATVQIGNQCWMRDNLRTTTSPSTGTYLIPAANANYTYTGKQAFWYNNDSATYAPQNYGLLYNWNAAVDTFNTAYGETSVNSNSSNAVSVTFNGHRRGICPAGWHLPSDAEWTAMEQTQTSMDVTGTGWRGDHAGKLAGEGWSSSTTAGAPGNASDPAHNASGFSAVPAGNCGGSSFYSAGYDAYFWSSPQDGSYYAYYAYHRYLYCNSAYVLRSSNLKANGFSVRCLRD